MLSIELYSEEAPQIFGLEGFVGDVFVCNIGDVDPGLGLKVELPEGRIVAVWLVGGEVFITDDTCTHGQASLTEDGALEGFTIECGLHQGAFDIRTGEVTSTPCRIPLRTYRPQQRGDSVYISSEEFRS